MELARFLVLFVFRCIRWPTTTKHCRLEVIVGPPFWSLGPDAVADLVPFHNPTISVDLNHFRAEVAEKVADVFDFTLAIWRMLG